MHATRFLFDDPLAHAQGGRDLLLAYPYFETKASIEINEGGTYADRDAEVEHTETHEWNHPLGLIVTELINAGLILEFLHEHRELDWQFLDTMTKASDGDMDGAAIDADAGAGPEHGSGAAAQQPAAEGDNAGLASGVAIGGTKLGFGGYRMPAHQRDYVPCMFSLRARKPAS